MSGVFELILWALGLGVAWVVINSFIKAGYDSGYSDGLKVGEETGKAHAKYDVRYRLERLAEKDESVVHILSDLVEAKFL